MCDGTDPAQGSVPSDVTTVAAALTPLGAHALTPGLTPPNHAPAFAGAIGLAQGVSVRAMDSSAVEQIYLAELPCGRQFQIAELLYRTLQAIRRPVPVEGLGDIVLGATGCSLTPPQIAHLVESMLLGSGLAVLSTGVPAEAAPEPAIEKRPAASVLSLHWSREVFSAETLAPLTARLAVLYSRGIVIALLAAALAAHAVVFLQLGFPPRLDPSVISLAAMVLMFFSVGMIHELGHLAASRRYGCPHGAVGVGLYFFSPVWFADVSAAWRLSRGQRAVVDLGGSYFEFLCVIPLVVFYLAVGNETALWAVVIIDMTILMNLNPLLKFDGYWLLSDLTGVPNLHRRAGERIAWALRHAGAALGLPVADRESSPFARLQGVARIALPLYAGVSAVVLGALLVLAGPVLAQVVRLYPPRMLDEAATIAAAVLRSDVQAAIAGVGGLVIPCLVVATLGILAFRLVNAVAWAMARRVRSSLGRAAFAGAAAGVLGLGWVIAGPVSQDADPAAGIGPGEQAPDFSGRTLGGKWVRLVELRGRAVYLKFWSPNCRHCVAEIPQLRASYRAQRDPSAFVTVAVGASSERIQAFVDEHGIDYPVIPDPDGRIVRAYRTEVTPTAYHIGADGRVVRRLVGPEAPASAKKLESTCARSAACAAVP